MGVQEPSLRVLRSCLLRSYLVGANFNTRGLQNIGFSYALDPGLRAIHQDPEALAEARRRYVEHYNTHPFWTPLLLGVILSLELNIARGRLPAHTLGPVFTTATYTLSAIGDSVFGGALLIFWALCTACLLVTGQVELAVVSGGVLLAGLQVFKVASFLLGLREGLSILAKLKRLDLINWGRRLKMANALLLVVFWWLIWPRPVLWQQWAMGVGSLWLLALLAQRSSLPRGVALLVLLAAYALGPYILGLM